MSFGCLKNVSNIFKDRGRIQKIVVRYYEIPKHLKEIGTAPNPSFYRMVEYFYHRAVGMVEPSLLDYLKKHTHLSDKKRKQRVAGILRVMGSCNSSLQCEFPLQRKNGEYDIIQGYRSQHSVHRLPCKGGLAYAPMVPVTKSYKFCSFCDSALRR